jgi:malate dehydrogenase (oxaloacetate-decarboxylating)(NADP+)
VSIRIAVAVAEEAYRDRLAQRTTPSDIEADIRARVFEPVYRDYI